jgi:hypothetical protein
MYPSEFGGKARPSSTSSHGQATPRFTATAWSFSADDRLDAHNYFDDSSEPVPDRFRTNVAEMRKARNVLTRMS